MDRAAIEEWLERFVTENRFTIAVVFPTVGAALLIGSAEGWVPAPLSFQPLALLFGTAVMRLPLIAGVVPLLDRRGAIGLLGLTGFAYAIELVGVVTGVPYGEFAYLIDLGPMVLDAVPVGLPVFFLPLVVNSYLLVVLLLGPRATSAGLRVGGTLLAVLAMDLVLDPGAVGLGFWAYEAGGWYYGVPLSNFAGWLLSGTVSVAVFDAILARGPLLDRLEQVPFMLDDVLSFVLLWGGVNLYFGHLWPATVAGLLGLGLLRTGRFDVPARPRSVQLGLGRRR
jgi:putative membrane protein